MLYKVGQTLWYYQTHGETIQVIVTGYAAKQTSSGFNRYRVQPVDGGRPRTVAVYRLSEMSLEEGMRHAAQVMGEMLRPR